MSALLRKENEMPIYSADDLAYFEAHEEIHGLPLSEESRERWIASSPAEQQRLWEQLLQHDGE